LFDIYGFLSVVAAYMGRASADPKIEIQLIFDQLTTACLVQHLLCNEPSRGLSSLFLISSLLVSLLSYYFSHKKWMKGSIALWGAAG